MGLQGRMTFWGRAPNNIFLATGLTSSKARCQVPTTCHQKVKNPPVNSLYNKSVLPVTKNRQLPKYQYLS